MKYWQRRNILLYPCLLYVRQVYRLGKHTTNGFCITVWTKLEISKTYNTKYNNLCTRSSSFRQCLSYKSCNREQVESNVLKIIVWYISRRYPAILKLYVTAKASLLYFSQSVLLEFFSFNQNRVGKRESNCEQKKTKKLKTLRQNRKWKYLINCRH